MRPALFQALANAVLILHVAFILFVVLALLLVMIGGCKKWRWISNIWFRLAHLAAIAVVVAESWAGITCPLTTLELWLRSLAGQHTYQGDFIAFWFRQLFFFAAPGWIFTLCYSLFGALVAASWLLFPPRCRHKLPSS